MTCLHLSLVCASRGPRFWADPPWDWALLFQNAALFWWNLHRSGEGDSDTLHAGCPVLVGDKWGKSCLSSMRRGYGVQSRVKQGMGGT